jgi:hypothetical protein
VGIYWAFDWCMNFHTRIGKNFGRFLTKGGTLTKKKLENRFSIYSANISQLFPLVKLVDGQGL